MTTATTPPATPEAAYDRLREYSEGVATNPELNSVQRLAQDYFFALSKGEIDLGAMNALATELGGELFEQRAARLAAQHGLDAEDPWAPCTDALNALAAQGFDTFKARIEAATGGLVFTAHPTFAHARATRAALAATASGEVAPANAEDTLKFETVTLASEHEDVQEAIIHAQHAVTRYLRDVFAVARKAFPNQWRNLEPYAPTVASWVSYDLDGRDDIRWWTTLNIRLTEKAMQLRRYAGRLATLTENGGSPPQLAALAARFKDAAALTQAQADHFADDLSEPSKLVIAANALTAEHPARLTALAPVIDDLRALAADAEDDLAAELSGLASEMKLFGLGTARIHLRINAAQIQSVIRRDLGVLTENGQMGRVALETLASRLEDSDTLAINFADLFLEKSTARRQMMLCSQVFKHIDEETPIRFLIAESENPATVMGAVYLARQYGVDHLLDISPLFETPEALANGGRFIARLLQTPGFPAYVRGRGRLSIQLGFSDAGRFIGQLAADMAIERIHNLIAKSLAAELPGVGLLVFNTHGESMGRGGYPGSFENRLNHLLTPWTRARCAELGIPLEQETSFQGGDGYLHFGTDVLADSAYAHIAAHALADVERPDDPFYVDTNFVWDFYRALRNWQEDLFEDADYGALLGDFAGGFRVKAGSRPTRRAGGPTGPRSLRAISHNATLQQLSAPANTACGVGSSLQREIDDLVNLIDRSPRLHGLIDLAVHARILMSVPALRAYAGAYSPAFWVACAKLPDEAKKHPRTATALALKHRGTHESMVAVANHFAIDLSRFDQLIAKLDHAPSVDARHERRRTLHALHALRIGGLMRALEIAGGLPSFSARHGIDIEAVRDLIMAMRLGEAADLLGQIFPVGHHQVEELADLTEPRGAEGDLTEHDYVRLQEELVAPLRAIETLNFTVASAIAHAYGAYG